jgi:hypothetical protein
MIDKKSKFPVYISSDINFNRNEEKLQKYINKYERSED